MSNYILATYIDEYDDTYDDELEKSVFDPIAAVSLAARQRDRNRPGHSEDHVPENPNHKKPLRRDERTGRINWAEETDSSRQSSENSRLDRNDAVFFGGRTLWVSGKKLQKKY